MTDPQRRSLLLGLLGGGAATLLGGCASSGTAKPGTRHYTETISSVLISSDDKHLVAIGRDHYYAFDAPPLLVRALHSPEHPQLHAAFTPFHVDAKADVSGDVVLELPSSASPEAHQAAERIGLSRLTDGSWLGSAHLTGHRYTSWAYRSPGQQQEKLSRTYTVEFTADEGLVDTAVDKSTTPLRLAADGVQLIYYAPLAPLIIPFVFLTRARDH
jgi:hypothetical protein